MLGSILLKKERKVYGLISIELILDSIGCRLVCQCSDNRIVQKLLFFISVKMANLINHSIRRYIATNVARNAHVQGTAATAGHHGMHFIRFNNFL